MSQYFSKPYEHAAGNVKIELDLCNYAEKTDMKEIWLASKLKQKS